MYGFNLLEELQRRANQQAHQRLQEQLVELTPTVDTLAQEIADIEFEIILRHKAPLQFLPVMLQYLKTIQVSQPTQHAGLLAEYHAQFPEFKEVLITIFKEYIEMKDSICINGQRIDINEAQIEKMVRDYTQNLDQQEQTYHLNEKNLQDLPGFILYWQNEYQQAEAGFDVLTKRKTSLTMQQQRLLEKADRANARFAQTTFSSAVSSNFVALCQQNNLAKLQFHLNQITKRRVIYINHLETVSEGHIKGWAISGLHMACYFGHLEIVRYLLEQGANAGLMDEEGYTPLHRAVMQPNVADWRAIVDLLLATKAVRVNTPGCCGRLPLHTAAYFGHIDAANYLISLGALLNKPETQPGHGRTSLHTAAYRGHAAIVETLLANGAVSTRLNDAGETALLEACLYGQGAVVNVFSDHGLHLSRQQEAKLIEISTKRKESLYIELASSSLQERVNALTAAQAVINVNCASVQDDNPHHDAAVQFNL